MNTHIGEIYASEFDEAHEADMRQLRKEQLHADISPEEAEEEMRLHEEDNPFSDMSDDDFDFMVINP